MPVTVKRPDLRIRVFDHKLQRHVYIGDHVCTRACLRRERSFTRTFYRCARYSYAPKSGDR